MIRAIPYTSLWFGIIVWVIFGGSLTAGAAWWLYEDYLFATDSATATGVVERLYTTTSHGRHGTSTTYHIAYHYQAGTFTISTRTTATADSYHSLSVGRQMPILYIKTQVANNRIDLPAEERGVRLATWGLSLAALAVHVIGTLILLHYLRQNRLYSFLLASGMRCEGQVDSVPYDLVGKNRTQRFYLMFTFTDGQGQSRSGRSWYLKPGREASWRTGNPVQVYFDPANSERFTVKL